MSQRWRAVGKTAYDLTGTEMEPHTSVSETNSLPFEQLLIARVKLKKLVTSWRGPYPRHCAWLYPALTIKLIALTKELILTYSTKVCTNSAFCIAKITDDVIVEKI